MSNLGGLDKPSKPQTPKATKSVTHVHDWRLMRYSTLQSRHANAPPTCETIIDIVFDPGYETELWTCPGCGEDRFKYRPGFVELLTKEKVNDLQPSDPEAKNG